MATTRKAQTYTAHQQWCYDSSRWAAYLWQQRDQNSYRGSRGYRSNLLNVTPGHTVDDEQAVGFATELFERLYGDPARLKQADAPAWMERAHEAVSGPSFEELRGACAQDADLATLVTTDLLGKLGEQMEQLTAAAEEGDEQAMQKATRAMGAAVRKAAKDAQETAEAVRGLLPGKGAEQDGPRAQVVRRLYTNEAMRTMLKRAGRMMAIADKRNRVRSVHAREEVVDIERGGDVARILPSGLARLHHPLLRKLALREVVERTALQYRLEGKEPQGRGPIVMLLDTSGSMEGEPLLWAQSIGAMALMVGAKEKRPCIILPFNIVARNPIDTREVATSAALQDLMKLHASGGTDFSQPLRRAMEHLHSAPRADLLIVTDGLAECDDDTAQELQAMKDKGARVYGLTVNGGSLTTTMQQLCTSIVDIDEESDAADSIGQKVL